MPSLINKIVSYTYLIKFKVTGQVYYGSRSKNIKLGLSPEQDLMIHYFTSCKPLKKLIKKYGVSAFEWQIRRRFDIPEQAGVWEQKVLRRCKVLHDSRWFNQNIAGFIIPTPKGLKKISEFHKGKPKSEDHKKRISEALKGKVFTVQHIENLRKSLKGKNLGVNHYMFGKQRTAEQNQHQSEIMKGRPAHNKGIPMSDEQKKRISETKKNIQWTDEQRENFRKAQLKARLGKKLSIETKTKISNANKGKKKSEEHRKNLSISHKGIKRPNFGPRGEKAATAKLNEKQVLDIRSRYIKGKTTYQSFANEFGVSNVIIYYIISRKTWKHI